MFLLYSQSHALENMPTFTSHWKGDEEIAAVEGDPTALLDSWPWAQEFIKTNLNSFPTDTYSSKLLYVNPGKPLKEMYYG